MSIVLARKKLNDKTKALVGEDAGPSHGAHEKAYLNQINAYREKAKTEYLRATYAFIRGKRRRATLTEHYKQYREPFGALKDQRLKRHSMNFCMKLQNGNMII
jgi:hypothetical protein